MGSHGSAVQPLVATVIIVRSFSGSVHNVTVKMQKKVWPLIAGCFAPPLLRGKCENLVAQRDSCGHYATG